MKLTRRFGAVFAALALALVAVSPALATDLSNYTPLPDGGLAPADVEQGTEQECEGFSEEGMVLWHFVLHDQPNEPEIIPNPTLTATFENASGGPESVSDSDPMVVDHTEYLYSIIVPDDWTLTGASTDEASGAANGPLLLSHVCFGEPPVIVPEAPASALLVLTAGLLGLFFIRRQAIAGKAPAA